VFLNRYFCIRNPILQDNLQIILREILKIRQYSFSKIVIETVLSMARNKSKSDTHYLDLLCTIVTPKYRDVHEKSRLECRIKFVLSYLQLLRNVLQLNDLS
jgi:hypothetical protein